MKARLLKLIVAVLVLAATAPSVWAEEPLTAVFPMGKGREQEQSYPYQLLRLVLEKSGKPFTLKLSSVEMPEERARRVLMENGGDVTVMWSGTAKAFEEDLLPVRIPTTGGLLGYRLFLVNQKDLRKFAAVRSLNDLRRYTAGQGTNWSDVSILEASGLKVHAAKYHLLFNLLDKQRIDYFPRGANEIFEEFERFRPKNPDLAVEPNLVLVYPFASFFFVSKSNPALHDAIHQGFVNAHADGSFLEFFRSHPSTATVLAQARLDQRLRIDIGNPLMTEETLAIPSQYWFDPSWQ
ncbi:MAG: hypothetical protein HQL35_02825 [Alphaproteobacteria bacterium]|nr:hypothetical protein [Alphaproteobacteria bacterium]